MNLKTLTPEELLALATIVGCFMLLALGKSEETAKTVILTLTGYLFGQRFKKPEEGGAK